MIRVGICGYGYWGPNLVRNFYEANGAEVRMVCDRSEKRLQLVRDRYPGIATSSDSDAVFSDDAIDAVAIATPVSTHHPLALKALQAGKHVLVEKPLADSVEKAEELIAEAEKRGLTLMVDHTFLYTGAVNMIKQQIDEGNLGEILYFDSVRVNLGLFQHDIDVIWDLAVHDLSILDYILPDRPRAIIANGKSHIRGQPENIAYLSLLYDGNLIANIHVNWLAPVKVRRTLVGGRQKMIVYDDLDPFEKVKVYDKGVTVDNEDSVHQTLISYRTGDMWAPKLDSTEALTVLVAHFVDCIENGAVPRTDGSQGLWIVKMLEGATRSMRSNCRLVDLK